MRYSRICGIPSRFQIFLRHISTVSVRLHETTDKFKIERGDRQGDTIPPKSFTTLLECMFKNIEIEDNCNHYSSQTP